MPLYDMLCCKCNHLFSVLAKYDDTTAKPCPECNSAETNRQLCAPAINAAGCPGADMKVNRSYIKSMVKDSEFK
jgi:putative FmdB family regulatory protein